MTTYLRYFNYDEAFEYYCGLIDKVLNVFKEEKNKGGFKALLQLLMVTLIPQNHYKLYFLST